MPPLHQHPRYQLHDQLGHGGFSSVYRAWDKQYSLWVAVKVFLKQDEEGVRLCHQEYRRTNTLQHPNIIRFIDFGVDNGSPYIVMPYYARGSMQDHVGEMNEEELWRLASDISGALAYMHSQQPAVLHNDLKPDNFLIADDGSYILMDFGISFELNERRMRSLERGEGGQNLGITGEVGGKGPLAYQAPELFHYQDHLKQPPAMASEVWAFGASLYELATGDVPFGDQGGLSQLVETKDHGKKIYELCEPLPARFSGAMNNLIFDCLHVNPWDRPRASFVYTEAQTQLGYMAQAQQQEHWPPAPYSPGPAGGQTIGQPYVREEEPDRYFNIRIGRKAVAMGIMALGLLLVVGLGGWFVYQAGKSDKAAEMAASSTPDPSATVKQPVLTDKIPEGKMAEKAAELSTDTTAVKPDEAKVSPKEKVDVTPIKSTGTALTAIEETATDVSQSGDKKKVVTPKDRQRLNELSKTKPKELPPAPKEKSDKSEGIVGICTSSYKKRASAERQQEIDNRMVPPGKSMVLVYQQRLYRNFIIGFKDASDAGSAHSALLNQGKCKDCYLGRYKTSEIVENGSTQPAPAPTNLKNN